MPPAMVLLGACEGSNTDRHRGTSSHYASPVLPTRDIERHIARIMRLCAGLPEVEIRHANHYGFVVRGKRFATYLIDYRGDGRVFIQFKAARGVNAALVASDARRFFLPPYMAHHGWIGLYVDEGPVDWGEVEDLLVDAYKLAAPKALAKDV